MPQHGSCSIFRILSSFAVPLCLPLWHANTIIKGMRDALYLKLRKGPGDL
jgi:hypothetical protein